MRSPLSFAFSWPRLGLALGLCLVVAAFGCFKDPKLGSAQPRKCESNKNCPWDQICSNQVCCASSDGKTCSTPASTASTGTPDGSPNDGVTKGPETGSGGRDGGSTGETGGAVAGGTVDAGIDSPLGGATGGAGGSGAGTINTGGSTDTGGTSNPGGPTDTGGTSASGGVSATGGMGGTGGVIATAGTSAASGGTTASAGSKSGGAGAGGTAIGGSGGQSTVTCGTGRKNCNGTCIATSECCGGCSGNTPVCSNGTCVGRPLGEACQVPGECASGVCADNVCCNEACSGVCEACNLAGNKKGTCSPTTAPRAGLSCTTDATYPMCSGSCDGAEAHRKVCSYPPNSIQCVAGRCDSASNSVTDPRMCDGLGRCGPAGTARSCSPYTCQDALVCSSSCPVGEGTCGGTTCVPLNTDIHCGTCSNNCTTSSRHCAGGTTCVQCTGDSHCSGSTPKCNTSTNTCVQCTPSGGCSGDKPVCSSNVCVQCATSPDCATRTDRKHVCSLNTCIECASNSDCSNYADAPKCQNGTCVRCLQASDCSAQYGSHSVCKGDNTCACRQPSSTNLLIQSDTSGPGFDGSLGRWSVAVCEYCSNPLGSFDSEKDADNCPSSGSAHVNSPFILGSVSRCVVAQPDTRYYLGYSFLTLPISESPDPESELVNCTAVAYQGSTCSGDSLPTSLTVPALFKERSSSWVTKAGGYQFRSSYLTGSILVTCTMSIIGDAWFDWVYLSTVDAF